MPTTGTLVMENAPSVREDLLEGCRHGIRRGNILQRNVAGIPPYPKTGFDRHAVLYGIALGYLQYLGKKYRSASADSADMAEKGWKTKKTLNIVKKKLGHRRRNSWS
ncbi:hypothetical protein RvY_10387 [Ramazzottius varieornatus]|uniref:Uncharacterized protein n=1 Tax=Ramazzottius varieornatus TaxID=947166 RepID=A0A1D1VCK3_RAMVA|nr:hypothetical protein RvY_10387 [Ramazzottius varieornatus]